MTNPDELERAVERLTSLCGGWTVEAANRASAVTAFHVSDVVLILSANRKMRESLDEMLVIAELYLSSGDKTARRLKDAEFGPAMARARITPQPADGCSSNEGAGGWIEWSGGENPAPGRVVVAKTVWDRDTGRPARKNNILSDKLDWGRSHRQRDFDIIAYRILPQTEKGS